MKWTDFIRDIPDFPKPGILFKDITPLLSEPKAFCAVIDELCLPLRDQGVTKVCGIESRGFLFGIAVAQALGVGFVPLRKKGKLPAKVRAQEYALEYGTDIIEIHDDALTPKDKVVIVDDVIATGGTVGAALKLVQSFDAKVVACSFVIELEFLIGRQHLPDISVHSLLKLN